MVDSEESPAVESGGSDADGDSAVDEDEEATNANAGAASTDEATVGQDAAAAGSETGVSGPAVQVLGAVALFGAVVASVVVEAGTIATGLALAGVGGLLGGELLDRR